MHEEEVIKLSAQIPEQLGGKRIDQALADLFPKYSRQQLKHWLLSGACKVDGEDWPPKKKVHGLELVDIIAKPTEQAIWQAQDLPLNIIYEDQDLLVVNKPAACVVHPGAGNFSGTLVNALLHYEPKLQQIPRAGIVHRLDKDTTGLLVVAKTLIAHNSLVAQLQARAVSRIYHAVVSGVFVAGGTVEAAIGRHPVDRKKMAVQGNGGKPAITHYKVLQKFAKHTYLQVKLDTGRTHQIRVHMAHLHRPIAGDKVYSKRSYPPLQNCSRQLLHAKELELVHPATGNLISWNSPLPEDFIAALETLNIS